MHSFTAFLTLGALAVASSLSPLTLTQDCSDTVRGGPWAMTFSSLTLSPDPPVKGQAASWIAKSTAGSATAITAGQGTISASLDGVTLYTSPPVAACGTTLLTLPLGTGVMNITSLPCPLAAATPTSVSMALTLGTAIPSGTFAIVFKMRDASTPSKGLYCMNASFAL